MLIFGAKFPLIILNIGFILFIIIIVMGYLAWRKNGTFFRVYSTDHKNNDPEDNIYGDVNSSTCEEPDIFEEPTEVIDLPSDALRKEDN